MVERFGFAEVREVSTREVQRFAEHMKAEADDKSEGGSAMARPTKTELTQAEYDETLAAMRGNAQTFGRRRN